MADDESQEAATETTDEGTEPEQGQEKQQTSEHRAILADLAKERRERKRLTGELEKVRTASLSDQERAVAEAKAAGRIEGSQDSGRRLARAEIRAQGAVKGMDVTAMLEDIDLSRFVGDDGEPNDKAIAKAIERWGGVARRSDIGQGYRETAPVNDMNVMIRRLAGHQ